MEGRDVPSFHVLSSCLQDGLASQTSNPWPPEVIIVAMHYEDAPCLDGFNGQCIHMHQLWYCSRSKWDDM